MGRVGFSGLIGVGTRRHSTTQPAASAGGPGALLVWGRDIVSGHCRTDVLVCGPTSPPEKASGENTLVLLVQAPEQLCLGDHMTRQCLPHSMGARADGSHRLHLLLIPVSVQGDEHRNTRREGWSHTKPFLPGPEGVLLYVIVFEGREAIRFADSQSLLKKNKAAGLKFVKETSVRSVYLPEENGPLFNRPCFAD